MLFDYLDLYLIHLQYTRYEAISYRCLIFSRVETQSQIKTFRSTSRSSRQTAMILQDATRVISLVVRVLKLRQDSSGAVGIVTHGRTRVNQIQIIWRLNFIATILLLLLLHLVFLLETGCSILTHCVSSLRLLR